MQNSRRPALVAGKDDFPFLKDLPFIHFLSPSSFWLFSFSAMSHRLAPDNSYRLPHFFHGCLRQGANSTLSFLQTSMITSPIHG
jgi:hypothetical protein